MISSIRIKNFKAIKDSGDITFSPFTAIIGRNGSGKSSLIEGIEFIHDLVTNDLEYALQKWKNYKDILYKGVVEKIEIDSTLIPEELIPQEETFNYEEMDEDMLLEGYENEGYVRNNTFDEDMEDMYRNEINISSMNGFFLKIEITSNDYSQISESFVTNYLGDVIYIPWEKFQYAYRTGSDEHFERKDINIFNASTQNKVNRKPFSRFKTVLSYSKFAKFSKELKKLQYLNINHYTIGNPLLKPFARDAKKLSKDGSNLYNSLYWIYKTDINQFKELEKDFKEIIEYTTEVRETITSDIQSQIFYSIVENRDQKKIEIPSWLASTGSQKILALLSIIHNPDPAPLVIIEEFENGLDPWTICFLIKKFKEFIDKTDSQIIITTHSPTLLNFLKFEEILFAKRDKDKGVLEYIRFDEEKKMFNDIQKDTLPGELYEKMRKKEEEAEATKKELEKISKQIEGRDKIKCLIFTEDEKKEKTHEGEKYLLEVILKASGFNMDEITVISFKGKDNIKSAILGSHFFINANYPNIHKIVFHIDRDVNNDKDKETYMKLIDTKLKDKGIIFYTKNYDAESYFLNPEHIHLIIPTIDPDKIKEFIRKSIEEKDGDSFDRFHDAFNEEVREFLAEQKKKSDKNYNKKNIKDSEIRKELMRRYETDRERFIYGKQVFRFLCSLIRKETKKNALVELLQPSPYLKDEELEKISKEIWGKSNETKN